MPKNNIRTPLASLDLENNSQFEPVMALRMPSKEWLPAIDQLVMPDPEAKVSLGSQPSVNEEPSYEDMLEEVGRLFLLSSGSTFPTSRQEQENPPISPVAERRIEATLNALHARCAPRPANSARPSIFSEADKENQAPRPKSKRKRQGRYNEIMRALLPKSAKKPCRVNENEEAVSSYTL